MHSIHQSMHHMMLSHTLADYILMKAGKILRQEDKVVRLNLTKPS